MVIIKVRYQHYPHQQNLIIQIHVEILLETQHEDGKIIITPICETPTPTPTQTEGDRGPGDPTPTPTPTLTPTPTFGNYTLFLNTHSIRTNESGIYAQPTRKSGDMTFMFWFKFPEKNTSEFGSLFWCPGSSSTNISANHTTTLNLYIDETKNSYGLIYGDGQSWTAPTGAIGAQTSLILIRNLK